MKVYIAGPMRGIPLYNFPAFDAAHFELRRQGHEVKDPAEMDRILDGLYPERLPPDHDWNALPASFDMHKATSRDIETIRFWADAVYMLDGWEKSTGARAEKAIAEWCGKRIIYQTPAEPAVVVCLWGNGDTGECPASFTAGIGCSHAKPHEKRSTCRPSENCPGCEPVNQEVKA